MSSVATSTPSTRDALTLHKAVVAIHIAPRKGRLTLTMRRTYNVLLKLASEEWNSLPESKREQLLAEMADKQHLTSHMQVSPAFTFSTKVGVVLKALKLDRKNTKLIYDALEELRACKVEWNMMLDGGEETFISGLISEVQFGKAGRFAWSYGLNLFEMLMQPSIYQVIDLELQTEFTRYSAQALYENAIRYSNLQSTGWKPELKWRELLSPDGSPTAETYSSWKSRTLKRALDEMNAAARCPIVLSLEEQKGLSPQSRQLRFLIKEKPHATLFQETPIPHDKQLVALLVGYGFDMGEINELLARFDPDYVMGNLAYVEAQVRKGKVKVPKAYVRKALAEDYRHKDVKVQEKLALARQEQNLAEESRLLDVAFEDFQKKRLREKFEALPAEEQFAVFEAFKASGSVLQENIRCLIEERGLAVLKPKNTFERSAAGSFFTWLRAQKPPLLCTPEETDKYVFAGLHRRANSIVAKPASAPQPS